jgi:hypothetical protein
MHTVEIFITRVGNAGVSLKTFSTSAQASIRSGHRFEPFVLFGKGSGRCGTILIRMRMISVEP